jgi:hypothetical protein
MQNASRRGGLMAVVFLATLTLLVALVPRAVSAVGSLVSVQDGDGTSKAQVDNGKLRVGDGAGSLTVDGKVQISNTATKPARVRDFQTPVIATDSVALNTTNTEVTLFTVPAGKVLVIETVSVELELQVGQSFRGIILTVDEGGSDLDFILAPTFVAGAGGARDTYTFSGPFRLYASPGAIVKVSGSRIESTGTGFVAGALGGYLTTA